MAAPQDTDQKRRRLRPGPVIAVLAVMVVVLLCVVGLLAARAFFSSGDEPDEGKETTSSAPPTASDKPLVREDLKVTVGEGGSGKSQNDPSVPINTSTPIDGQVILVDYDPSWPEMYAREEARIRTALGDRALVIHRRRVAALTWQDSAGIWPGVSQCEEARI